MSVSEKPTVPFLWATPHIEVGGYTEPSVADCCVRRRNVWAGSPPDVRRPCTICNTSDWPPDVLTSLFVSVFCPNPTLPWTGRAHLHNNKTSVINGVVPFDPKLGTVKIQQFLQILRLVWASSTHSNGDKDIQFRWENVKERDQLKI
jgi:hypothetical protein